ncbi:hypothetical protein D3C78_1090870 [compost metagenome]
MVKAGPIGTRAGRPISTDMAIKQLRVKRFEAVVIDLEFSRSRQTHVVVHYIGPTHQRFHSGLGLPITQLQRHAQLAALGAAENPFQASHRITFGRLDLDHFSPQVCQQHASKRAGQVRAEVQHLEAMQGWQGGGTRPRLRRLMLNNCIEQFGVPFSHQRRTGAGSRRWLDLPGRPWLKGLAHLHVVDFDHIAIHAGLFVKVDLAKRRRYLCGNIVLPEMLDPLLRRPSGNDCLIGAEVGRHMAGGP